MVLLLRLPWFGGAALPGYDGFGASKEHREPRHGEFPAAMRSLDEGLTIWTDPILYVGLQASQHVLVEVLRRDRSGS